MTTSRDALRLTSLVAELHATTDENTTLERILDHTVALLPEADHVSLSLRGRRGTTTLAATSALAEQADALQQRLHEGPGVDLGGETQWIRSGDLGTEQRWPQWAPAVAQLGLRSALSIGLATDGKVIGALHLFAHEQGRFNDSARVDLALLFSIHVANAVTTTRVVSGLEAAIGSRHTIGLAQGILMERYGIDQDRAFEFLRRMSSTSNRKLREVAADVAADGEVESQQAVVGEGVCLTPSQCEGPASHGSPLRAAD